MTQDAGCPGKQKESGFQVKAPTEQISKNSLLT